MIRRISLLTMIILIGAAVTPTATAMADGPDPIAVRQAGFALNGGDFNFIRAVVAAKGDVKPLEAPAKGIGKWAAVIPTLFPKGTETGGETKALPEIWSDPAGFKNSRQHSVTLRPSWRPTRKPVRRIWLPPTPKLVGEQCGACHKAYRAK